MVSRASKLAPALWLLGFMVFLSLRPLYAKETDQFTDRLFQIERMGDSQPVLDAQMNLLLKKLEASLNEKKPSTIAERDRLISKQFQSSENGLLDELRTPFEYWVRDKADAELFWVDDWGIYGGRVDYDDMSLGWYIELSPVIRIGKFLVGIDKLGHFLGQGWFYYQKLKKEKQEAVLKYGHELERTYLGLSGIGVYSFGDLAANWQGSQFYLALFGGPKPYFSRAANGEYTKIRDFHFLDYVTDDWDEVLNPSRPKTDRFYGKVADYLRKHECQKYKTDPKKYLNSSGKRLDPKAYIWKGATEDAFPSKHSFDIKKICG